MHDLLVLVGTIALLVLMVLGCVLTLIDALFSREEEQPEGRGRDMSGW